MLTDDQLDEMYDRTKVFDHTVSNFITGLRMLEPLMPRKEYFLGGEHDVIYIYAGPPTSDEQQIKLDRLGFRYDEDCDSWRYYT